MQEKFQLQIFVVEHGHTRTRTSWAGYPPEHMHSRGFDQGTQLSDSQDIAVKDGHHKTSRIDMEVWRKPLNARVVCLQPNWLARYDDFWPLRSIKWSPFLLLEKVMRLGSRWSHFTTSLTNAPKIW